MRTKSAVVVAVYWGCCWGYGFVSFPCVWKTVGI